MAAPFEMIKKGIKAMNPFGGNATPPAKSKGLTPSQIKEKGKEIEKDLDKDKVPR